MRGLDEGLQVLEVMEQLNEDAKYEVEHIDERIANIDSFLEARKSFVSASESELARVGGKQIADESLNELEQEKRDQDNRCACQLLLSFSEVVPM